MATGRSIAETADVVAPWTASYDPALKVARGETLDVTGTDRDNLGWRWCRNAEGLGGWLPDDLVKAGRAVDAFDSAELTVAIGNRVGLLEERAGWWLCRNRGGQEGWIPERRLRLR